MAKYRILSIDGGGIRGVIPAVFLQRLSQVPRLQGWLDSVNLLAGTSTGGLLALGIAHGIDIAIIRQLYEEKRDDIFDDSWMDDLADLGNIIGAEYDGKNLRKELKEIFGNATLAQLNKRVLITSFDLDSEGKKGPRVWKPKLFHNFPGPDSDGNELAYKVGMYTSVAPTYFPSEDGYIDGGVYAPNPSMCAVAQTQDLRHNERCSVDDIVLFSLGTGRNLSYIPGKSLDWGKAQWAKRIIDLIFEGVTDIAHFQCKHLLGTRYQRLAPDFPAGKKIPLDAIKQVRYMVEFAMNQDITAAENWIADNWL